MRILGDHDEECLRKQNIETIADWESFRTKQNETKNKTKTKQNKTLRRSLIRRVYDPNQTKQNIETIVD